MKKISLLLILLIAGLSHADAWAATGIGLYYINEGAGIYGFSPGQPHPESGTDLDDIAVVQANLPIANEGITGGWQSLGVTLGPNPTGPDLGWTVEFGTWQESPNMGYVRWTAPPGGAIVPQPYPHEIWYFWLKVPSYLVAEGRAVCIGTDSAGHSSSAWTSGAPVLPENYVPEPSSFVALIGGLGCLGAFFRRRRF